MKLTIAYDGTPAAVDAARISPGALLPAVRLYAAPDEEDWPPPSAMAAALVRSALDSGALIAPAGLDVECHECNYPGAKDGEEHGFALVAMYDAARGVACRRLDVRAIEADAAKGESPSDPQLVARALELIAATLNEALALASPASEERSA